MSFGRGDRGGGGRQDEELNTPSPPSWLHEDPWWGDANSHSSKRPRLIDSDPESPEDLSFLNDVKIRQLDIDSAPVAPLDPNDHGVDVEDSLPLGVGDYTTLYPAIKEEQPRNVRHQITSETVVNEPITSVATLEIKNDLNKENPTAEIEQIVEQQVQDATPGPSTAQQEEIIAVEQEEPLDGIIIPFNNGHPSSTYIMADGTIIPNITVTTFMNQEENSNMEIDQDATPGPSRGHEEPNTTLVQEPLDAVFIPFVEGNPSCIYIAADGTISISTFQQNFINNIEDATLMVQLDAFLIPLSTWVKACDVEDNYQSGKLLFDQMHSVQECQQASKSGRNYDQKLCPQKQLAITRGVSWKATRSDGDIYDSRQSLKWILPSEIVNDLIKKIFQAHRHQLNIKHKHTRTKKTRKSLIDFIPITLTDEYYEDITWAENYPKISRNTWAAAFIEVLRGNTTNAAGIIFDGIFPQEEQLVSTVNGTKEKPGKPATYPLDQRRCNGIVLIHRWMTANTLSYPYNFPPLWEEDLIGPITLTTDELYKIKEKVFTGRPNQCRQRHKSNQQPLDPDNNNDSQNQ